MITDREIPRSEWHQFFEGFTRRHRNGIATVSVISPKLGAQREATGLPLDGIVSDPSGRTVSIFLGVGRPHVDHPVADPRVVWVEIDERGREVALEIESEQGTKTILEFRRGW